MVDADLEERGHIDAWYRANWDAPTPAAPAPFVMRVTGTLVEVLRIRFIRVTCPSFATRRRAGLTIPS